MSTTEIMHGASKNGRAEFRKVPVSRSTTTDSNALDEPVIQYSGRTNGSRSIASAIA